MNRCIINIPHVEPKLQVECNNDKVMYYLENAFSPCMHYCADKSFEGTRMLFHESNECETLVEINGEKEKCDIDVIRYLGRFFLMNSAVDSRYVMLHGGGVVHNNNAFLFLGGSGAGKSTLIAHLCMEGFEYLSDDRLIIDPLQQTVLPFPKTIILRPQGSVVLKQYHANKVETKSFRYNNICKEFFNPPNSRKVETRIASIFVIRRSEDIKVERVRIDEANRIRELLKYNMAIRDCINIKKYAELSKIPMETLYYSDMNEVGEMIRRYSERS